MTQQQGSSSASAERAAKPKIFKKKGTFFFLFLTKPKRGKLGKFIVDTGRWVFFFGLRDMEEEEDFPPPTAVRNYSPRSPLHKHKMIATHLPLTGWLLKKWRMVVIGEGSPEPRSFSQVRATIINQMMTSCETAQLRLFYIDLLIFVFVRKVYFQGYQRAKTWFV